VTILTLKLRRNTVPVVVLVAALVATTAVAVPAAHAGQLADERAQAQALSDRIDALGQQESALAERYDSGAIALQRANARVAASAKALASAKAGQAHTLKLLEQAALEAYVGGGPQVALADPVPLKNLNEALLRQEFEETLASSQADVLDQYRLAAALASTAHQRLVAARNADASQLAKLDKYRQQVQGVQDQVVAAENQVKGKIAVLVAQIRHQELLAEQAAAARAAAAERAAAARAAAAEQAAAAAARVRDEQALQAQQVQAQDLPAQQATSQPPTANPTFSPPPSASGAAIAVAAAESRVGDPYVWGAAGPDAFDCSGLTMWAWAQAGANLPHFSGDQYYDTTHIPLSDLEPGDLVFPADPGQHVAMYVGNGEIVQAPYTGEDVQIVPLTGYFVLASRVG
jgi:cell wall-associated NlpC family hydrolase